MNFPKFLFYFAVVTGEIIREIYTEDPKVCKALTLFGANEILAAYEISIGSFSFVIYKTFELILLHKHRTNHKSSLHFNRKRSGLIQITYLFKMKISLRKELAGDI